MKKTKAIDIIYRRSCLLESLLHHHSKIWQITSHVKEKGKANVKIARNMGNALTYIHTWLYITVLQSGLRPSSSHHSCYMLLYMSGRTYSLMPTPNFVMAGVFTVKEIFFRISFWWLWHTTTLLQRLRLSLI